MTIDEAIQHCDEKASTVCGECAEEHRQLAAWLRELEAYRADDTSAVCGDRLETFLYECNLPPYEDERIKRIEKALGFKLFIWQKTMITRGKSRRSGETTARIVKLLTETNVPLDLTVAREKMHYCEWCTGIKYAQASYGWFERELREIKENLENGGVECRAVKFTREEDGN